MGSNPVASTTWQGQPEMPYLSAFPVLFLRVSNEPCVDRMAGGCRELAHRQTHGRLDTYGECRDSHELRSSEVTCRHGSLRHKGEPYTDMHRQARWEWIFGHRRKFTGNVPHQFPAVGHRRDNLKSRSNDFKSYGTVLGTADLF